MFYLISSIIISIAVTSVLLIFGLGTLASYMINVKSHGQFKTIFHPLVRIWLLGFIIMCIVWCGLFQYFHVISILLSTAYTTTSLILENDYMSRLRND